MGEIAESDSRPSTNAIWKEIADLPIDLDLFRDRELESLYQVWAKQKETIDPQSISVFNEQFAREWAIETGIIENVYTLERGITTALIERGIDAAYIPHGASNLSPENSDRYRSQNLLHP